MDAELFKMLLSAYLLLGGIFVFLAVGLAIARRFRP